MKIEFGILKGSRRVSSMFVCALLLALPAVSFPLSGAIAASSGSVSSSAPHKHRTMPVNVLGIAGDPTTYYAGIPWIRLGYVTCGKGLPQGNALKEAIQHLHRQGKRVILSVCQWSTGPDLFNMKVLNDAALGGADAVQCGNEQMKSGRFNRYITPSNFARFFDLCGRAMHTVRPGIPILLGSLDPHVGGVDYQPLLQQVAYLNAMQAAMNTQVHRGGNWQWRDQVVGLIDSWHNGYPSSEVNSLYWLFVFWSQQFQVNLYTGELGQHLWVIEGTGCIHGCGINDKSAREVAIAHILTLIIDVQTSLRYSVPFFYFSGKDFLINRVLWEMGVLTLNGHSKPLRQDLRMGARVLKLTCGNSQVNVADQEQLLARLYAGCTLPENYISILKS